MHTEIPNLPPPHCPEEKCRFCSRLNSLGFSSVWPYSATNCWIVRWYVSTRDCCSRTRRSQWPSHTSSSALCLSFFFFFFFWLGPSASYFLRHGKPGVIRGLFRRTKMSRNKGQLMWTLYLPPPIYMASPALDRSLDSSVLAKNS